MEKFMLKVLRSANLVRLWERQIYWRELIVAVALKNRNRYVRECIAHQTRSPPIELISEELVKSTLCEWFRNEMIRNDGWGGADGEAELRTTAKRLTQVHRFNYFFLAPKPFKSHHPIYSVFFTPPPTPPSTIMHIIPLILCSIVPVYTRP